MTVRRTMAATFYSLCITLASLIVLTMSSSSPHYLPLINEYDKTCFVPPSSRPTADDTLFLLKIFIPDMNIDIEYITYPNGTCGLDIYLYFPNRYLEPSLVKPIEKEVNKFSKYCIWANASTELQLHIKLLTLGNRVTIVPVDQLSRVPTEWKTNGIVVLLHLDHISVRPYFLQCDIPYFYKSQGSEYNFNASLQLNGCPSGYYGGSCEYRCSCAEAVECHSFNGACMCPVGLKGAHCNQSNPNVTVENHHVFIPYGETFKLTCTAYGMSMLEAWSWTKDGEDTFVPTTYKEEEASYWPRPIEITATLVAYNASVNGGYMCEIRDDSGEIYTQKVEVTVIAIPNPFLEAPQAHTALVGTNTSFTCKTKSEAGRVLWVKGRNQPSDALAVVQDSIGRYAIKQPSEGVSELHIYGVEFSDEDVYRCFVGFTFKGKDLNYAEAALGVQSDPLPICLFQDIVTAPSGELLTLRCFILKAKPAPMLAWSVEVRKITPPPQTTTHTKLSADGVSWDISTSVMFVPAPEDDGKTLSLILKSPAWKGSRTTKAMLNITYAPLVTITPDPITLTPGQDASIACSADANPKPTSLTWTMNYPNNKTKQPISQGPEYVIRNAGLIYNNASLTCVAKNSVGKMEKTSMIRVADDQIVSRAAKIGFSISGGLCLVIILLTVVLTRCYRKEIMLWWAKKARKTKDKEFDVFISYKSSSLDEAFVIGNLIPRLEQDGYSVCVHYRHFMPGKSILDNISEAVHSSHKTLLLLSPGFIESEWCRYEFQAALSEMLHQQSDLIPVIFKDLGPLDRLSPDLQAMLRTLSYVTWPGAIQSGRYHTQEDEEKFWALLWQALPQNPLGRQVPTAQAQLELVSYAEQGLSQDLMFGDRVPLIAQ